MYYCIWRQLDQYFALELLSSQIEIKCVKKMEEAFSNIREPLHIDKKNAQLLFICIPKNSGAARVFTTFLGVTRILLTKDTFH